jgi:hypothetical protein
VVRISASSLGTGGNSDGWLDGSQFAALPEQLMTGPDDTEFVKYPLAEFLSKPSISVPVKVMVLSVVNAAMMLWAELVFCAEVCDASIKRIAVARTIMSFEYIYPSWFVMPWFVETARAVR